MGAEFFMLTDMMIIDRQKGVNLLVLQYFLEVILKYAINEALKLSNMYA